MQLPVEANASFAGVIDLLTMQAIYWTDEQGRDQVFTEIPDEYKQEAAEKHAQLIERIAELDDDLTVKFLEGDEITVDELKQAMRKAVLAGTANPVFCGSALRNKGVQPVLDAVIDYLPSPLDIPAIKATDLDTGELVERPPLDTAPLSALVFKIVTDPYVGRLAYFRVYSGKVVSGSTILNSGKSRREKSAAWFVCMRTAVKMSRKFQAGDIAGDSG